MFFLGSPAKCGVCHRVCNTEDLKRYHKLIHSTQFKQGQDQVTSWLKGAGCSRINVQRCRVSSNECLKVQGVQE